MKIMVRMLTVALVLSFFATQAWADKYAETKKMFTEAGIGEMFDSAYGYALFPTIAKGGLIVGAAYGKGRVFKQGKFIGDTELGQASIGFQIGASGFSQVIFFQDDRAISEFTSGNFEFGAEMSAVALTAAAGAATNTAGNSASASGGKNNAAVGSGGYNKGMATYTIVKGGAMLEVSLGGQTFTFTPPVE